MNFIQLTIEANEEQQETLIALLEELQPTGFEQQENELLAYFDEENFDKEVAEAIIHPFIFSLQIVPNKNWNQVWESNFEPVIVEDFCAVRAHFHAPITGVEHEILITPKMSFGTGHHATTYMMMQQMRSLDFKSKTVFDFGTGTGILAILAEQLGAAAITATDIDEWSIINAAENIEQNHCSKISLYQSSTVPQQSFDIILANINRNIILQNIKELSTSLFPSGKLLLSGLLKEDEATIKQACTALSLVHITTLQKGAWISLLYTKD